MISKSCDTIYVKIFICGDYQTAEEVIRNYLIENGLCVTLQRSDYIYTGGAESGIIVGLNNYPRFPTTENALLTTARILGEKIMIACSQSSFMIQGLEETIWYSRRKEIEDKNSIKEREQK